MALRTALLALLWAASASGFKMGAWSAALTRRNSIVTLRAEPAVAAAGPSALVLGWFGAKDNELDFVAKIYKKKGFSEVVVEPSLIASCSKPRGWYRSVKKMSSAEGGHPLSRRFDTVHVMSGGFLNLYLNMVSGAQLDFDTLILDSTPILPKPESFTRFARAYMATGQLGRAVALVPKLVPAWLHLAYVTVRWTVSSAYVGLRHQVAKFLDAWGFDGGPGTLKGPKGLGHFTLSAMTNRYDTIVNHCIETVFGRKAGEAPLRAIFVTNKADPYLNYVDVKATMAHAKAMGCTVEEVEGYADHVKSIFRKPGAIFGGLDAILKPSKVLESTVSSDFVVSAAPASAPSSSGKNWAPWSTSTPVHAPASPTLPTVPTTPTLGATPEALLPTKKISNSDGKSWAPWSAPAFARAPASPATPTFEAVAAPEAPSPKAPGGKTWTPWGQ